MVRISTVVTFPTTTNKFIPGCTGLQPQGRKKQLHCILVYSLTACTFLWKAGVNLKNIWVWSKGVWGQCSSKKNLPWKNFSITAFCCALEGSQFPILQNMSHTHTGVSYTTKDRKQPTGVVEFESFVTDNHREVQNFIFKTVYLWYPIPTSSISEIISYSVSRELGINLDL